MRTSSHRPEPIRRRRDEAQRAVRAGVPSASEEQAARAQDTEATEAGRQTRVKGLRTPRGLVVGALLLTLGCASASGRATPVPVAAPTESLATLTARLASSQPSVRADAAWALAGATDGSPSLVATLEALLSDPDRRVRQSATWALAHLDPEKDHYDDETPPRPIRMTQPVYPDAAFSDGVEGTVVIELLIGESGEVAHSELRISIPALDDAALECVRQWRFEPARGDGRPVAAVARAPVTFRIHR